MKSYSACSWIRWQFVILCGFCCLTSGSPKISRTNQRLYPQQIEWNCVDSCQSDYRACLTHSGADVCMDNNNVCFEQCGGRQLLKREYNVYADPTALFCVNGCMIDHANCVQHGFNVDECNYISTMCIHDRCDVTW